MRLVDGGEGRRTRGKEGRLRIVFNSVQWKEKEGEGDQDRLAAALFARAHVSELRKRSLSQQNRAQTARASPAPSK